MEALASHDDIRGALIASLKDRVDVARQYLSLNTPENLRERLAVLAYAAETSACRSLDELKRYHASALRLIEEMAHNFGGGGVDGDTRLERISPGMMSRSGNPSDCIRQTVPLRDTGCDAPSLGCVPEPGQNRPATNLCPDCDGDPTHPGVVPCYDCQTVCVHDRGCQEVTQVGR